MKVKLTNCSDKIKFIQWLLTLTLSTALYACRTFEVPQILHIYGSTDAAVVDILGQNGYEIARRPGGLAVDTPILIAGPGFEADAALSVLAGIGMVPDLFLLQKDNHIYSLGQAGLYFPTKSEQSELYADACGKRFVTLDIAADGSATLLIYQWRGDRYSEEKHLSGSIRNSDGSLQFLLDSGQSLALTQVWSEELKSHYIKIRGSAVDSIADCSLRRQKVLSL